MLTDIFATRYAGRLIWSAFTEVEQRLLNQSFGVVKDALPYFDSAGKVIDINKGKWKSLHDRLAREIGVDALSTRYYSYTHNTPTGAWPISGEYSWDHICHQFVTVTFTGRDADRFVKERLSFVELGLRLRGEDVVYENRRLEAALTDATFRDQFPRTGMRVPGSAADGVRAQIRSLNATFEAQVEELNERFRRARAPVTYHNGYLQLSVDQQVEQQIAKPFWDLVSGPLWTNVDIDMKEAIDRRDSNAKDPAIFAAKALESAIKIVSDTKGWTRGTETGAAHYVDNLVSKTNGGYLAVWEGDMLKDYFRKVRNSLGHGPGSEPMPELTLPQTDWAIETAMSWVRTLVRRMQ
jgi:hypothetical protein